MREIERLETAKKKADETAYRKGLREGWDQAMWLVFGLAVVIAWITY